VGVRGLIPYRITGLIPYRITYEATCDGLLVIERANPFSHHPCMLFGTRAGEMEWYETSSRTSKQLCEALVRVEAMKGRGTSLTHTGVSGAMGCRSKDDRRV
jgi:hypothetical protein